METKKPKIETAARLSTGKEKEEARSKALLLHTKKALLHAHLGTQAVRGHTREKRKRRTEKTATPSKGNAKYILRDRNPGALKGDTGVGG